jgi:hypothetical protein
LTGVLHGAAFLDHTRYFTPIDNNHQNPQNHPYFIFDAITCKFLQFGVGHEIVSRCTIPAWFYQESHQGSRVGCSLSHDALQMLHHISLSAEKNRTESIRTISDADGEVAPYLAMESAHISSLKQMDVDV